MPETRTADSRNVAALSAKTLATSATASRNAADAGPTKKARLSMVLATLLAAVSSSGSSTSDGVSAIWAGPEGRAEQGESVASTKTTAAGPSACDDAAAAPTSTDRARSQPIITVLRGHRSARAAANGATTAISASRLVAQMPTAEAPPMP